MPFPKWVEVDSSNIAAIRYYAFMRVLLIRFNNGSVYRYEGVPPKVVGMLIGTESIGRYFYSHIRTAYDYTKES